MGGFRLLPLMLGVLWSFATRAESRIWLRNHTDEVLEIQTTLDLFIEEATRRLSSGSMPESVRATEPVLIPARN